MQQHRRRAERLRLASAGFLEYRGSKPSTASPVAKALGGKDVKTKSARAGGGARGREGAPGPPRGGRACRRSPFLCNYSEDSLLVSMG